MSVYPTFDQPPSSLFLSHTTTDIPAAVAATHSFNHALEVIIPLDCDGTAAKQIAAEISRTCSAFSYYKASLPLSHFLDETFLKNYVRQGGFTALRVNARLDTDDVFAILPTGHLLLSLTKDTYESLGLVGKASKSGGRHVVKIDLSDPSFKPGDKHYDRVKWCFSHTINPSMKYDFYFSFVNITTNQSIDINPAHFPAGSNLTKYSTGTRQRIYNDTTMPDSASIQLRSFQKSSNNPSAKASYSALEPAEHEEWKSHALELIEWFGLLLCDDDGEDDKDTAEDIPADPFYSVYTIPEPTRTSSVIRITSKGFISTEQITSVLKTIRTALSASTSTPTIPWALVAAWGFRDAPVSFRNAEHGYGENDWMVLMKRMEEGCLLAQALGAGDAFVV
ncbi:ribonuclease P 40kDa subunit-domain-containing protein [Fimicolochytrium jonesii]|uniref:ribonuclease P 40kDa subunit-domain-containing protein n=1 Tax=Fimicolochytrium jonesii TaxID=1396493 RepID=UPI0022FE8E53|nr:ribonuclease P 40kDa subunit-domain-containing protein [Fimicolochytrium jonesii]KAI8825190.1 ribonuclease P 40kDa subunit-domain-containing protein [Fimicolochytrium jonesii]